MWRRGSTSLRRDITRGLKAGSEIPDKPFADQQRNNPESWNLYSYTRNNPRSMSDHNGREIILAPGIRYHDEMSATVGAILSDPVTRAQLEGYIGPKNPDLVFTSGDLSAFDTKNMISNGAFNPEYLTSQFNNEPPNTRLAGATITMDNRLSKGDLSKTALHEIKHAGDARKDPEGFQKETKSEKELDRDKQKTEQRADKFRDENADRIKKEVDDFLKQMHVIKAFEKKESK